MGFLIHPDAAYLLVIAAVMLILLNSLTPASTWMRVGMLVCLAAAAYELFYLPKNPWSFLLVALSPLPFFAAARQPRGSRPLAFLTILMLFSGAFFLVKGQDGPAAVDHNLAAVVSILGGSIIWIALERRQPAEGARLADNPASVVGLIGETRTEIEPHSAGSVLVEGELWQARSQSPIRAGRTVRVLRQDGAVLTVKETKKRK